MKPRVLHLITVYNGRAFVPRAIESAMRMDQSHADIDVLILDDASPEPGWSAELKTFCEMVGAQYYCAPRNLGIPRNCSLGLSAAIERNYDYVTINNSDVIFPKNLIAQMISALKAQNVGSVTAWSNNVSIYSLENADPDQYLSNQKIVDFVSDALASKYTSQVLDIPAGISFCIMMPTDVVRHVGVMDPIFGRGYCEETDWSLRSLATGYRLCLAPGTFVYHQGRGSNVAAGLVSGAHTTVPENEAIIDQRHPQFRQQCQKFEESGILPKHKGEAIDYILNHAASQFGYRICNNWEITPDMRQDTCLLVDVDVANGNPVMKFSFAGFEQIWRMKSISEISSVIDRFGKDGMLSNSFSGILDVSSSSVGYPIDVLNAF